LEANDPHFETPTFTIVEVMESWPLQLLVAGEEQNQVVDLDENVHVISNGKSVAVSALSHGQRVHLHFSSPTPAPAIRVEIL